MNGRRQRFRLGVAAIGIGALILAGSLKAAPTEAAWVDAELASSAAVTAATLAVPTASTCAPRSVLVLGLQDFTLTWTSTQPGAQMIQVTQGANTGTDVQGTQGSVIAQTGSTGTTYQYRAVVTQERLLGLLNLSSLLGGRYVVRIFNGYPGTSWRSAPVTYNLDVVLLGLGSTCTRAA
ncbi:hypothetical protein OED01_09550 [Microbacterium sp. M28]|uniref:hypothetical protein n=1 Tax=Microbacterium sp. M28 TaxID=2962064 RepID=UPI0021F424FF|nr:hypothetical protein [Microbacterium sp. M28]UYO95853.1 hypothetical protein OED01_09550 [Microbacterium sp. M28]